MRDARRFVREGSRQAGALKLSEASDLLAKHAAESSALAKEDLELSASEFAGLAERILDTTPVAAEEMDAVLTRAYWALAAYNYDKAAAEWQGRRKRWTGAYLTASAMYIDEAIGYYSGGLEAESEALVSEMRQLGASLSARADVDEANVTAQIEDFGQTLEAHNRQVRQAIETYIAA